MTTKLIESPTRIQAAGNPPKQIEEFIGRVNTGTSEVSIARMVSPAGWEEPGQTPHFNEYTVVLKGALYVRLEDREIVVKAGQAVMVEAGDWVQYRTPEGAEYIATCVPAFSPETVDRDKA
jgi:quercetin dioxygenase-like cupin family protein